MRMRRIPHQQAQRPKATHYFVPASVDQAALPQAVGEAHLDRADQPRRPVGDHQQRRSQPAVHQLTQEAGPGVVALAGPRGQPDQHRTALGGQAPGAQHRLGPSAGMHPEMGPSRNRYSSSIPPRSRSFQASNSVLIASQTRLTVDFDRAASGPSASAKAASTSRTDRPRTNPDSTSASNALVRDTPLPSSREVNGWVVPRSLGRSSTTRPAVVLTVSSVWPLRYPTRSRSPRW